MKRISSIIFIVALLLIGYSYSGKPIYELAGKQLIDDSTSGWAGLVGVALVAIAYLFHLLAPRTVPVTYAQVELINDLQDEHDQREVRRRENEVEKLRQHFSC